MIMEDDALISQNEGNRYLNWTCAVPRDSDLLFPFSKGVLRHKALEGCENEEVEVAHHFSYGYSMIACE